MNCIFDEDLECPVKWQIKGSLDAGICIACKIREMTDVQKQIHGEIKAINHTLREAAINANLLPEK